MQMTIACYSQVIHWVEVYRKASKDLDLTFKCLGKRGLIFMNYEKTMYTKFSINIFNSPDFPLRIHNCMI